MRKNQHRLVGQNSLRVQEIYSTALVKQNECSLKLEKRILKSTREKHQCCKNQIGRLVQPVEPGLGIRSSLAMALTPGVDPIELPKIERSNRPKNQVDRFLLENH